jgi:hypothetical protein
MSTGLKVGLIVGGSVLGLILIVVVIVAMIRNARERQREAMAAMQKQPPIVFNQPGFPQFKDKGNPQVLNPPMFNPQLPGVHAPVTSGPHTVGPGGLTINEQITAADPRDFVRGFPCKVFTVNMVAGKTYTIRHNRVNNGFNNNRNNFFLFDPYLRLEDSNNRPLAEDDDSGGNQNALLIFRPQQTGVYRVIATTFNNMTGRFTLQITVN